MSASGKPAVDVQSYKDQPSSILAVQSDRADAFFSSQAPLTYFVEQSRARWSWPALARQRFQGPVPGRAWCRWLAAADVLLDAFEKLHENGTYDAIMDEVGPEANILDKPGINMG